MAPQPEQRPSVQFTAELPELWCDIAGAGALAMVTAQFQELLDCLGIPASAALDVRFPAPAGSGPEGVLWIDGSAIGFALPASPDVAAVAERIVAAGFAARELLIGEPVVHAVWRAWFSGDDCPRDLASDGQWLLRQAVRSGLRLDRVRQAVERLRKADGHRPLGEWFEDAVAETVVPSTGIRISRAQYEQCYDSSTREPRLLTGDDKRLPELLALVLDAIFYDLGLYLKPSAIHISETLDGPWFRVCWNDIVMPPVRGLEPGAVLVNASAALLRSRGVSAERAVNPANNNESCVTRDLTEGLAKEFTTWGPAGYLILALSAAIRAHAGALVTARLTDLYLVQLRRAFPDLVEAVTGRFDRVTITRVFRALLDEQISLRDLRAIFEALLAVDGVTSAETDGRVMFQPESMLFYPLDGVPARGPLGPAELAECVRLRLRRYISHKYTRGESTLETYLLDRDLERRLEPNQPPLAAEDERAVVTTVSREIHEQAGLGRHPVVLTDLIVRRRLRRMLERDLPHVTVLSYQELQSDLNIRPLVRISVPGVA